MAVFNPDCWACTVGMGDCECPTDCGSLPCTGALAGTAETPEGETAQ